MEKWVDDTMKNLLEFLDSLDTAQKAGKHEFICPLCGGKAQWRRAESNGHLHCKCFGCGFSIME